MDRTTKVSWRKFENETYFHADDLQAWLLNSARGSTDAMAKAVLFQLADSVRTMKDVSNK